MLRHLTVHPDGMDQNDDGMMLQFQSIFLSVPRYGRVGRITAHPNYCFIWIAPPRLRRS